VPDHLIELVGPELTVAVYPADLALSGSRGAVARARAAVTRDVRSVDAWFTTAKESQAVEDRLVALEERASPPTERDLDVIDRQLVGLIVPQEEWEVLYRRRLQLVTAGHADVAAPGVPTAAVGATTADGARTAPAGGPSRRIQPARSRVEAGTVVGIAMVVLVILDIVLTLLRPYRPERNQAPRRRA
jgi:hypothetical protein